MDVERYYKKAYLYLPEDGKEREDVIKKFERLVDLADEMLKEDTEGLDYYEITSEISSPLREDEVEDSIDRELIFKNTKHREYGYFKLDNIMEE